MKEMNYDQSVEIDDVNVVKYADLKRLARMLDIPNDVTNESWETVKRRLGITGIVTKEIFTQNKSRFVDSLVGIIVDRAIELGYDNDDTKFMSFYNFAKGYPAGKYLVVPQPPEHPRPPTRYIDTDVGFLNQLRHHLPPDPLSNPFEVLKHESVKKRFNERLGFERKRFEQKKADDEFFKQLYPRPDPLSNPFEFNKRESLKNRFRERLDKEKTQIKTSKAAYKAAYKAMLDKLMTEPVLLRPLPPKEMIPLKPYSVKLFEKENEELINYFDKFGHEFKSSNPEYLTINEPNDEEKAKAAFQKKKYHGTQTVNKTQDKKPIVVYYLNDIHRLEDIFNFLENTVYKSERKPFKITFDLTGIFETPRTNFDDITDYIYEEREIRATNFKNINKIPILIQLNDELEKVKYYIESVLFNYSTTESDVKLIYVTSVAFKVSRLVKVTGKVKLPDEFIKSKLIITDNDDDGLCWYRFLCICLDPKLGNTKKYDLTKRTSAARKLLCQDHGVTYSTRPTKAAQSILNSFNGMSTEEMKASTMKNHINVNVYNYSIDEKRYDIQEQWYDEKNGTPFNALLFSDGMVCHIMYIIDAEKLTNIFICPKCRSYVVRNENNHGQERMNKHITHCDGKFKKKYIPERISEPYCPHILNHPVYEYCLAHDLEWKPQQLYMTYDFETMEHQVNIKSGDSTTINSELIPLSVSCCVKSSSSTLTKHFDARDPQFIPEWIKFMFEQAVNVVANKVTFLSEMVHIDDIGKLQKLDRNLFTVTVLGYNSARFDSNLFKEYLNYEYQDMKWSVDNTSLIGSPSSMKQFVIKSDMYGLRFIDAQSFVSQLSKSNQYIESELVNNLNGLTIKSQLSAISKIIANSTKPKTIIFLSKVTNFFNYITKQRINIEVKSFEFHVNEEDKYTICILHPTTKALFLNKYFGSSEFKDQINTFEKVCFEIKYPDEHYDSLIKEINELNKSLNDVLIAISAFITGSKTDGPFPENTDLQYVKLDSTVTTIVEKSFSFCKSLERIEIPSSVKLLEKGAFENCYSLQKVSLPLSITKISEHLFNSCRSLRVLVIPSSVTIIKPFAFSYCSKLEEVLIPSSVTFIGERSFYYCSSLTQVKIPSSVREIGKAVFEDCSSLTHVIVPPNMTKIVERSFYGCSKLKTISIPSSVTVIESYAFRGCKLLDKISIPSSVTEVKESAFENCQSLIKIKFPPSITTIEKRVFLGCSKLEKFSISTSVTLIKESAFENCQSLKQIIIPTSVSTIEAEAFSGCSSLTEIKIPSSISCISSGVFNNCKLLAEVDIPSSVTSIKRNAFKNCQSLSSISIPSSVTELGDSVFSGCILLKQLTLPVSITQIEGTFENCYSLTQISLPPTLTLIGSNSFNRCCSLGKIDIPSTVTSIEYNAFYRCKSLTGITIPSGVTIINENTFHGCSSLKQLKIPSSINEINKYAFSECSSLIEIIIPSSVTEINEGAFCGCKSLKTIMLHSNVTIIGEKAFQGCTSLDTFTIPSSVNVIGKKAFKKCSSLVEIIIPSSITKIEEGTFCECTSLKQIVIPESVTEIGPFSFYKCKSLTKIKIPASVTAIGPCSFQECSSLQKIKIPFQVKVIESNAFYGCSSLTKTTFSQQTFQIPPFARLDDFLISGEIEGSVMGSSYINFYEAKVKQTGEKVILNIYPSYHFKNWKDFLLYVHKTSLNLPGFLKITNFCISLDHSDYSKKGYIIATKYMKNGNIESAMKEYLDLKENYSGTMNPTIRSKIIFGVACSIKQLHKRNICHLNLKSSNVFLDDNYEPVIGPLYQKTYDPSLADDIAFNINNIIYIPVELLADDDDDHNGDQSDVYSFAFFMYRMFSNSFIFPKQIRPGFQFFRSVLQGIRPQRPDNIPDCYWELIIECWRDDPNNRPSFEEITNLLKDDRYAIEEFGLTTDLDQLHQYQNKIDNDN